MEIQFTIKSLENVPYKLVNLLDKTPKDNFPTNADLKLMIFESGKIVGISSKKIKIPYSDQLYNADESLLIGNTTENFMGSLVGPLIKLQNPQSFEPFAYANIRYRLEDEVTTGGLIGWVETNNAKKIERLLKKIQSAQPSDALYRRIQEESLLLDDTESSEFIEEIEGKLEQLSKTIRYYKK